MYMYMYVPSPFSFGLTCKPLLFEMKGQTQSARCLYSISCYTLCHSNLHSISTNFPILVSEKSEPFYDEFIEKQLLAGNILNRNLTVTVLSATVMLLAADHGKLLPGPVVHSTSSTELRTVSSQLSLQSIQEQDVSISAIYFCFQIFWTLVGKR